MARRPPTAEVLTTRALGRALLARQMLLARAPIDIVSAIERLAGLQAQVAPPPFVGLWSRLARVSAEEVVALAAGRDGPRALARGTLMRGTLHLVSARDFVAFRPVLGPMLARALKSIVGKRMGDLDPRALVDAARALFEAGPRPFDQLRDELAERFPGSDPRAPAFAVRMLLPLVQVPDGGRWGWAAKAPFTTADGWLGMPIAATSDDAGALRALVVRYLAAFGPASVADAQKWSGLAGLRATFEALRPELATFRDERGRELFDLPDAPRPPEDTPAPVRLVAEFDNLILSHDDRTRVVPEGMKPLLFTKNAQIPGTVLVDGVVAGTWSWCATRRVAELTATPLGRWPAAAKKAVVQEGEALLAFVAPGLDPVVRIAASV